MYLNSTLSVDESHTLACGIIERLFHFTARYAPSGDIGKYSDVRICAACGWTRDATWLITALVNRNWIDVDPPRLYVHDWHDHSDDAADKYLAANGLKYANGIVPRRKKVSRDKGRKKSSQSDPEPVSEPESKPEPVVRSPRSRPTLEQIAAYCAERGNAVDPSRFLDYYESKGWLIGKSPMKDWRAAVRTWERNERNGKSRLPTPEDDANWTPYGDGA